MKKILCTLLALLMLLSLAACGGGGTKAPASDGNAADSSDSGDVTGETYDTGSFKVLVPKGWKAFPQHDVFSDDPDAMNPDIIQLGKGASSDWDLFSKPSITINYAGPSTYLMAPSKDFYDDTEDMADVTTGDHTWTAFKGTSLGLGMIMLFEDKDDTQFQAALFYDNGGTISLDDADVQAILSSLEPSGEAE